MKIKQQQHHHHHSHSSQSNSPVLNNITPIVGSSGNNNTNSDESSSSHHTNNTANSPIIWTRSAASRAAQKKHNTSESNSHHNHHHQLHLQFSGSNCSGNGGKNRQHGHNLGRIVKPIPVRPMSSSSSSSSNHSLSGTGAAAQAASHHSIHNLKALQNLVGFNSSNSNSSCNSIINNNDEQNKQHSFSLIAKYFASFPATRLAKTTCHIEQAAMAKSSTPFLPFKKPAVTTNGPNSHVDANNNANNQQQQVHSTFVLRSHSLSANQAHRSINTDNLCTNFRRLVKLNDQQDQLLQSPSPLASTNTPTVCDTHTLLNGFSNSFHNNESSVPTGFVAASSLGDSHHVLAGSNHNQSHPHYLTSPFQLTPLTTCTQNADIAVRFGQITMETRSTRKFLIKHHPYLQFNNNNNNNSNINQSGSIQRPSINLMKKLNSKKSDDCMVSNQSVCDNRSGRSSRSNNSGGTATATHLNEHSSVDYNLLKFTDTAPTLKLANSHLKTTSSNRATTRRSQSNQKVLLTTASALNMSKSNTRLRKQQQQQQQQQQANHPKKRSDDVCFGDALCDSNDTECDSINDNYDEQEEDSSGYFSSYQSVDLISSSGGSCGGYQNHDVTSPPTTNRVVATPAALNKSDAITASNNINTNNHNELNTIDLKSMMPPHHHHYRTRYLAQFYHDYQSGEAAKTTVTSNANASVVVNGASNTSTPTTRLRYQQQLAAAQQAKEQFHLECELDLDQIEND